MRSVLLILFLFYFSSANSQIYRGINELRPYEKQLFQLDAYLKSNPKLYRSKYDTLAKLAAQKGDKTLDAILFVYEGSYQYYMNDYDTAGWYFDQAIERANEIGNMQIYRTAKIRRIFSDEYHKTKYQMAKEMEAIYLDAMNVNDTINVLYSLNGLGLFYGDMDSTSLSVKIYYEALRMADMSENLYEKAFILNNLGLLKYDLGAKDSAYSDFMQCLSIGKELNNLSLQAIAHQNLGLYYSGIDSFDLAHDHYMKVMKIGKEGGYATYELHAATNLATNEMIRGNPQRSDSLYQIAINIAKRDLILYTLAPIYFGRTFYLMKNQNYQDALATLDSAKAYTQYGSTMELMIPFFHLSYLVHEEMGDHENALKFYKQKTNLQDSLRTAENEKLLTEMQFRYDDEKKERVRMKEQNKLRLQLKQNEVDHAKFQRKVIIVISSLVVVLAIIVIFYFRLKQKSDNLFSFTIANKLEEERSRIARDLHDGLGQSMVILKNKFNKMKVEDEKSASHLNENFNEVIEEVRTISRSLIPPELRRLGLQKAVEKMLKEIETTSDMLVTSEIDVFSDLPFEDHQSIRIYRIVQELTTNTIKHSHATSIKIEATKLNDQLFITYQDNGTGLDMEMWKSANNSVGFKSIEQRLKYLKGDIKVEKPKRGFKVIIRINLD